VTSVFFDDPHNYIFLEAKEGAERPASAVVQGKHAGKWGLSSARDWVAYRIACSNRARKRVLT